MKETLGNPPFRAAGLRWWQWGLVGLGLVLLLLGLATLLLDPWLRRALEKQVARESGGRYELRVGELHTRLWAGSVQLRNVRLRTQPGLPGSALAARLPVLRLDLARGEIGRVGLWQMVRHEVVPIGRIVIDSLALRMSSPWPARDTAVSPPLYQRLPWGVPGVRIGVLSLRHMRASYRPREHDSLSFRRGDVQLRDVLISRAGEQDSQRIGYAAAVAVGVAGGRAVAFKHTLALGAVRFSSRRQRLQIDSLAVRPLQAVSNLRTRAPRLLLLLPRLVASGFDVKHLATRRLHIDSLRLLAPGFGLAAPTTTPEPLHEQLRPWLQRLALNHVDLTQGTLYVLGWKHRPTLRDITLRGTDVRVEKASFGQAGRLYYARSWRLHTGPLRSLLDGPNYTLAYQQLDLETKTGELAVKNLFIEPTLSPLALNRRTGYNTPHITALLSSVALHGCDFAALARRGALLMRELAVREWRLQIKTDSRFPKSPRTSKSTPETIGQLPFLVNIRRITLRNGALYTEYRPEDDPVPGRLSLTNFSATLTNITNDARQMTTRRQAVAVASARLQNQCPVSVRLVANLRDAQGRQRLTGRIGSAPLAVINPILVPAASIAIRTGQLQGMRFAFDFNRQQGQGVVWARYSDLKLTVLTTRDPKRKTPLTRVGTTLLNGILIRDNNPRRGELKPGEALTTRNLTSSTFTLWQHALMIGALNSVGVPRKLARIVVE